MKKSCRSILLTICLLFVLTTSAVFAAEPSQMDGKEYYKVIYNEYKDKPLELDINGLISAPVGTMTIDTKLEGFSPKAKAYKVTTDIKIQLLNKEKTEFKLLNYIEQDSKDLVIYHGINNKWTKQKRENMQVLGVEPNSAEQNLEIIKSVEVLQDTLDTTELKILFDFNTTKDIFTEVVNTDAVNFKNQKEKEEALAVYKRMIPYLNKICIVESVDKKNKVLTSKVDLTEVIQDAVNDVVSTDKKITAEDRLYIAEFLEGSKAVFTFKAKIVDEAKVIKIPKKVKRLAKEIRKSKPIKNEDKEFEVTKTAS